MVKPVLPSAATQPLPPQQTEAGLRLQQYPPVDRWDDWIEWDPKAWPRKVERHYMLLPTICFNCESACGLLGWVEKDTLAVRKFEGNPLHPGSRGRNCAKGPATINQVNDPDRILYPLKRAGRRGEGKWARVSWAERSEEHTSELQSHLNLVCRLLLEKKKK